VTVPLFDVKYHRLVSDSTKGTERQTPDQACMGIGDAVVAGFTAYRYAFTGLDGKPCVVIPVYGSNGVLFGAYEFTRGA
jgi:hypothetical protein